MGEIGKKVSELFETVGNELYKKTFYDEWNKSVIDLNEVKQFFLKQKLIVEGASKCLLSVHAERELYPNAAGDKFVVRQVILDAAGDPIHKTGNSYYGRVMKADDLASDLLQFMDGKKKIIFE